MSFLYASALLYLLVASPQQGPTPPKPSARACADSWNQSTAGRKNRTKSKKKEMPPSGACTELNYTALEIQEYLQSHARDQQWIITGDQLTEDSWTFTLELSKEELVRDTTEDSRGSLVDWAAGTVRVHVNTSRLADGYTRTIVRASFRGYGRSKDQFAPHKEYWDLDSNNNFENAIVAAIKNHFAAIPAEGNSPSQNPRTTSPGAVVLNFRQPSF